MRTHVVRSSPTAAIATAVAALAAVALSAPTAEARATSSLDPCTLLSTKQVAAVHVATSCSKKTGKTNPYYSGVSAIWGELAGRGSVILAVDKVANPAYIHMLESDSHAKGTSIGVGSWSRGSCSKSGVYCIAVFVVGPYVVELQVAPPTGDPVATRKPVLAMAKTVAGKLS